jgi:ketosteroid isomerase-like protein
MELSKQEIKEAMAKNSIAWDNHDLEGVLELYHDDIYFENWTGGNAIGKEALKKAWGPWFAQHGDFRFTEEEIFIDEVEQKVLYRWKLDWPSLEKNYKGRRESRRGADVLHFRDGKIIQKLTYSKTTIEIDGVRVKLSAEEPSR